MAIGASIAGLVAQATKPKTRNIFGGAAPKPRTPTVPRAKPRVQPDPHPSSGRSVGNAIAPRAPNYNPFAGSGGGHSITDPVAPQAGPFGTGAATGAASAAQTAAAAPPAAPDWLALAKADPRFLLLNPQFAAQENSAMTRYGYVLGPDGKYREATEAENPYSPLHQLRQGFQRDFAGSQGNAAAHGTLFSGGNVSGTQGLAQGLERNIFQNQTGFNDTIQGIGAQRDALITQITTDLMDNPEFAQPTPATGPGSPGSVDPATGAYVPHPGASDPGAPLPPPPKTGMTQNLGNITKPKAKAPTPAAKPKKKTVTPDPAPKRKK